MPDIYASDDGRAIHYSTSSWADARGGGNANSVVGSDIGSGTTRTTAITESSKSAGRGGSIWTVARGFFTFDTSGISDAPDSANLKIYGYYGSSSDVIAVKCSYTPVLITVEFDQIVNAATPLSSTDGSGAGTMAGTSVIPYSGELATWTTSGYNTISLNNAALSDMASDDTIQIALIDYDYDYLDIEPSGTNRSGGYFKHYTGTSRDPVISYTVATTSVADNAIFFGTNF